MKKIGTALLCAALAIGLAGCGSEHKHTTASETTATGKSTSPKRLSDHDLRAAMSKCSDDSQPGADMLSDQDGSSGYTLALTSFTGVSGKGVDSDVAQCVFDSLGVPDSTVDEFSGVTSSERGTSFNGMNVKWTNQGGTLSIYMSAESLDQ